MKKFLVFATLLMTAAGVFAQTASQSASPTVAQPGFRLLDGYLEKRSLEAEYGVKNGPWFLMGAGGALGVGAATVWFAGDSIADGAGVNRMSQEKKLGATLALGIGSAVLTSVGYLLHAFPPSYDEKAHYSAIYHEPDPALQEALAAARLQSLAETTRDARIVTGWTNLGLVALFAAVQVADNSQKHRTWSYEVASDPWGWQVNSTITGAVSLLVKSEEEKVYEEYQAVVARMLKD